jgi:hypothetical protein
MKIIVKFSTEDTCWAWVKDILSLQKKQGYINVIKCNNLRYEVNEPNMPNYEFIPELIEKVIKE